MTAPLIPYEIHITLAALQQEEEAALQAFCERHAARLLLIELARGVCSSQPMFSKVIRAAHPGAALEAAEAYARLLQEAAYQVSRIKLEIPASCAGDMAVAGNYYEWHGRIAYCREEGLLALCSAHEAHLSRNALRRETATRFVTLREYGDGAAFGRRLAALKQDLQQGGWQLFKEQSEYCIYDNNISLDQGWLS